MFPENEQFNKELALSTKFGLDDMNISAEIPDKTNPHLSTTYNIWTPSPCECGSHRILCNIPFQHGPLKENPRDGISEECLLLILTDRIKGHQLGQYSSDDNEEAIQHLMHAHECLNRRTKDREDRGVEGTSKQ